MTKIESAIRNPQSAIWPFMALLTVFVYFFGLTIPFVGPDEARYAQVAREMLERNDWITPTLGGFNWFEKPPLLYWMAMVSYKIFGVNEFAARFGPALFGLGTVVSLWILGRRVATESTENTEKKNVSETVETLGITSGSSVVNQFPNWLALIAASTFGIMVFSRGASFDIIITFPVTASLVSFYIWHAKGEVQRNVTASPRLGVSASLVFFYVFIAVALLAKGLIGIVFPFAIVGFYYLLSRRWPSRVFVLSLLWGTLPACLVAAIWYLPMYQLHGYEFIDEFFMQHHFQRFTSNKYQHPQPFYFFLWVLPLMTLPWMPFFFAAIWKIVKGVFHRRDTESGDSSSPRLLLSSSPLHPFSTAWLLVPLVFFSFSGSKLPGYILPAVPAAIILTTVYVYRRVHVSSKWRTAVLSIAASTFVGAILILTFAVPRFADTDSVKSLMQAANDRGYTSNRVLMLHTISHNAEFYAAGRIIRDETGRQRRLSTISEVQAEVSAENGRPVLVFVPTVYLSQLTRQQKLATEPLKDNGELTIAVVSAK